LLRACLRCPPSSPLGFFQRAPSCECVGVLLRYCVGVLVYYCVGVLVCYCVTVLLCWCVTVLVCWCVTVLVCWCVTVLLCYCFTALLRYCVTVWFDAVLQVLLLYASEIAALFGRKMPSSSHVTPHRRDRRCGCLRRRTTRLPASSSQPLPLSDTLPHSHHPSLTLSLCLSGADVCGEGRGPGRGHAGGLDQRRATLDPQPSTLNPIP